VEPTNDQRVRWRNGAKNSAKERPRALTGSPCRPNFVSSAGELLDLAGVESVSGSPLIGVDSWIYQVWNVLVKRDMHLTWLALIGVGVWVVCIWIAHQSWSEDPRHVLALYAIWVAFAAGGLYAMGEAFLELYGAAGLLGIGYYVGRAIINQAYADIRPDERDQRRRFYTVVQIVVVIAVILSVGWLVGIDWRDVLG
jgi:hypothetical protein